ncbi:MAG: signal peptidase I [Patescibacteria group bacterium]
MTKILNKLSIVFLLILFCFFGFSAFLDYDLKAVVSGSMEPEISVGSLVVIVPEDNLEVGDIITFRKGKNLVTHRVVSRQNDTYITAGDANDTTDPKPVDKESVVGEVAFSIPFLGFFIQGVQTPLGFTIFIFIGLLIILIEEILKTDEKD